ncbi:MAG: hypothetical protein AAF585_11110, partial [Verrucomicrobiota bacterium]
VGRMLEAIEGKESELDIERPGFSYGVKDALKGIKADIDTAAGETGSLMVLHNTVLDSYSTGSSESEMSHAQVLFSFVSEDHQRLGERLYLLQQTSEYFKETRKAIIAARENNPEGGPSLVDKEKFDPGVGWVREATCTFSSVFTAFNCDADQSLGWTMSSSHTQNVAEMYGNESANGAVLLWFLGRKIVGVDFAEASYGWPSDGKRKEICGRSSEARTEYVTKLFKDVITPLLVDKNYKMLLTVDRPGRTDHAVLLYGHDGKPCLSDNGYISTGDRISSYLRRCWYRRGDGDHFLGATIFASSTGLKYLPTNEAGDRMLDNKGVPQPALEFDIRERDLSIEELTEASEAYTWTSLTSRTGNRVIRANKDGIHSYIQTLIMMGEQVCYVDASGRMAAPLIFVGFGSTSGKMELILRDQAGELQRVSQEDLVKRMGDGCYIGVPIDPDFPDKETLVEDLVQQRTEKEK